MDEDVNANAFESVKEDQAGTGMDDVFHLLSSTPQGRAGKIILTQGQRRRRVHQAGRDSAAVMAVRFGRAVTGRNSPSETPI